MKIIEIAFTEQINNITYGVMRYKRFGFIFDKRIMMSSKVDNAIVQWRDTGKQIQDTYFNQAVAIELNKQLTKSKAK